MKPSQVSAILMWIFMRLKPGWTERLLSKHYVQTCIEGYNSFGFDEDILFKAVENSRRKCHEGFRTTYLLTPYLASINNLSSAVVKTVDKTMKITYTLTEQLEES